jgi:hypothetical protein
MHINHPKVPKFNEYKNKIISDVKVKKTNGTNASKSHPVVALAPYVLCCTHTPLLLCCAHVLYLVHCCTHDPLLV